MLGLLFADNWNTHCFVCAASRSVFVDVPLRVPIVAPCIVRGAAEATLMWVHVVEHEGLATHRLVGTRQVVAKQLSTWVWVSGLTLAPDFIFLVLAMNSRRSVESLSSFPSSEKAATKAD